MLLAVKNISSYQCVTADGVEIYKKSIVLKGMCYTKLNGLSMKSYILLCLVSVIQSRLQHRLPVVAY